MSPPTLLALHRRYPCCLSKCILESQPSSLLKILTGCRNRMQNLLGNTGAQKKLRHYIFAMNILGCWKSDKCHYAFLDLLSSEREREKILFMFETQDMNE